MLAKFQRLLILLIAILFFISITTLARDDKLTEDQDLETSIVLLKIATDDEVVKEDHFFELLTLMDQDTKEEYVLVPLNMISTYFEININFQRENNLIIVSSPETQAQVIINLTKKEYTNNQEWSSEAPVILGGDFFVSTKVLEFLYNITTEWDSSYQELIIRGDYFAAESSLDKSETKQTRKRKASQQQEEITVGDDYSVGSIQYSMELDYHRLEDNSTEWFNRNRLNLHGRWKDWALSLGLESKDNFEELSIPLIRATYQENNRLIIVGDSEFNFSNTLGEKNLRGVYYQQPDQQWNKELAYISIKGQAERGDIVTLYANDYPYSKIKVDSSQQYQFNRINLRNKRLNTLEVKIKKSSGGQKVIVKKLAGSPKIYQTGTKEIDFIGGYYQKTGYNDWDGKVVGVKSSYALDGATFNLESVINKDFNYDQQPTFSASDLGLAFRLGEEMVIDANFLLAGEVGNLEDGYTTSALYGLTNGYIEGRYFYIPRQVHLKMPQGEGTGVKLLSEWDLNNNWRLQSLAGYQYAAVDSDSDRLQEVEVAFLYQDSWRSSGEIAGRVERILFFNSKLSKELNRYGLILSRSNVGDGFRGQGKLGVFNNQVTLIDGNYFDYRDINLEAEIYKKLTTDFLVTNALKIEGELYGSDFYNSALENKTKLKWSPNYDTFFSLWQELEVKGQTNDFERIKEELGLSATYYLNHNNIINLDISDNQLAENIDYKSYSLRVTHFWPINKGQISVSLNKYLPQELGLESQTTFEIDAQKTLDSKQELEFKLGTSYQGISSIKAEYFISLSLNHAFGFAGEEVIPQKYNNDKHTSFVAGYVYLDENNNQIMDPEEEKIPGVKMSLDNLLATTDEQGQFQFNLTRSGVYEIDFDFNSLIADYTPVTKENFVKVRENENMILNYGLTINGSITGQVFADTNANGKLDQGEEPLSWVGFSLNDGEKMVYTDKRGEFYLENVPLGEHKLTVVEDSLPNLMIPKQGLVYKIKITKEKLDIKDLSVAVIYDFAQ